MDDQKKRELRSINKFLKLSELQDDEIVCIEESPDFLINLEGEILGIEVVEIFQSPPEDGVRLQHQESIKENIVENTESELVDEGLPPITVFISFNTHFRLNIDTSQFVLEGDDRYEFPPILAELVSENIPECGEHIEIYGVDCEQIPIKINSIKIFREEYYEEISVTTSKGGVLPPLDQNTLEQTINSKNSKVGRYRQKCENCWLLISSNDLEFEKAFDLKNSERALESCYEFDFERVFFLEEAFEELYEINLCT
jgi:sRNA-binding carbon storage regulator CsrA